MNLRISVTYPATDGSMPENVEVEWTDIDPGGVDVGPVLDRLLMAPSRTTRYSAMLPDVVTQPKSAEYPADDMCRRLSCGHHHGWHFHTIEGDPNSGACGKCDNVARCESFVGSVARGFTAGTFLNAGQRVQFAPDGFTLWPAGLVDSPTRSGPDAGRTRETISAGESMEPLSLGGMRMGVTDETLWVTKRETE